MKDTKEARRHYFTSNKARVILRLINLSWATLHPSSLSSDHKSSDESKMNDGEWSLEVILTITFSCPRWRQAHDLSCAVSSRFSHHHSHSCTPLTMFSLVSRRISQKVAPAFTLRCMSTVPSTMKVRNVIVLEAIRLVCCFVRMTYLRGAQPVTAIIELDTDIVDLH